MIRKNRKIVSILLSMILVTAMSTTTFAAGPLTDSIGRVEDAAPITASDLSSSDTTSQNTEVTITRAGKFSVTIPKNVVLPGLADAQGYHKANYSINVKGDIGSDEQISVVPDDQVILRQENRSDVIATVSQAAQIFKISSTNSNELDANSHIQTIKFADLNSSNGFTATDTGLISARNSPVGTWVGSYTYNIALESNVLEGYTISWDHPLAYSDKYFYNSAIHDTETNSMKFTNSYFINDSTLVPEDGAEYGTIDPCFNNPDGVYKAWSESFNNVAPSADMEGCKQIIYEHPDGTWHIANPYESGSILVKKNGYVFLEMYSGTYDHNCGIDGSCIGINDAWNNSGMSQSATDVLQLITIGCAVTSDASLSCKFDYLTVGGMDTGIHWYINMD